MMSSIQAWTWSAATTRRWNGVLAAPFFVQLATAFLAYFAAGKLGQATSNIRSSNLGPVWPAYGVALSAFLAYGFRIWPAVAASAFLVAVQGSVSPIAAAGQAAGATTAVATATVLLRRVGFEPSLSRLRDAVALIVLGSFGSALISASIGIASLYAAGIQPYTGIRSAWLIYWLGDSTGALLVTPLVFTLPALAAIRSRARLAELGALIAFLVAACFAIFGDLPLIPIRLHALAFAVLPLVMWGAIGFGIAGAAVCVALIATTATLLTALGYGPFSVNTPFINATLLDVLFAVLAITGLALAAVTVERTEAENERERLVREQAGLEARLRLAAIVESSDDAIVSHDLQGVVLSWNRAASRIFGRSEAETVGRPISSLIPAPPGLDHPAVVARLKAGERPRRFETTRVTGSGETLHLSSTVLPLRDAAGEMTGVTWIVRDVTDQKKAEHVFANVNRRLIDAQEQERSRIARELHDDIGQRLALLTVKLRGRSEELLATDIAADVQALSRELHPSRIELLGIVAASRLFCQEIAEQTTANVDFEARDIPSRVPPSVSLSLFRILQEALHNAAKHSGVRRFQVRLWSANGQIHLVIADRGAGFDVQTTSAGSGIGLITMKERIKLVGGDLAIDSEPGRGTTVRAHVPITAS